MAHSDTQHEKTATSIPLIEQSGLLEGTRCVSCRSFAVGFGGIHKNCQRVRNTVAAWTIACHEFDARPGTHFGLAGVELHSLDKELERLTFRLRYTYDGLKHKLYWQKRDREKAERAAKHNNAGYVYFAECVGFTKIGFSAVCPRSRVGDLQGASPIEIRLWAYARGEMALERELHKRFADKRTRREWFQLSNEDMAELITLANKTRGGVLRKTLKEIGYEATRPEGK